jgi:hypothetical protein
MKPTPLDYEIAKLIDQEGIHAVLFALCREANDRKMERLRRRLEGVCLWLSTHPDRVLAPAPYRERWRVKKAPLPTKPADGK